jgi:hypothetical protein
MIIEKTVRLHEIGILVIDGEEFYASEVYAVVRKVKAADDKRQHAYFKDYGILLSALSRKGVLIKNGYGGYYKGPNFGELCEAIL